MIAIANKRPVHLLVDKGYDTDAFRAGVDDTGVPFCIPPKSTRKAKIRWNRGIYRGLNRIERMIGHLKINRVVAVPYHKLLSPHFEALRLATFNKCLRRALLRLTSNLQLIRKQCKTSKLFESSRNAEAKDKIN